MSNIIVVGSSNTDMVIKSKHLPAPGETILGGQFIMNPGGKGANQAVAAARLGGQVSFIAKVGNDVFGQEAIKGFQKHGIDTQFIKTDDKNASGVALIMVDDKGENCISVALGANNALSTDDIDKAQTAFEDAETLLIQLETPLSSVEYAIQKASTNHLKIILNPAPAQSLSDELLSMLDIITPNETEAELLTGIKVTDKASAQSAATILRKKGIEIVIITLGAKGAYVLSATENQLIPAPKVNAIDTTAAGDTFNGALAVGLSEDMPLIKAITFANKAAAYSVTKMGAQASAPSRKDIE